MDKNRSVNRADFGLSVGVRRVPVLRRHRCCPMSEMGHQRRFRDVRAMSAYPPTPDVLRRCRERSKRARSCPRDMEQPCGLRPWRRSRKAN